MNLHPSPRDPEGVQPEVCALCGCLHAYAEMVVSDIEGLQGQLVGRCHGSLVAEPTFNDLRATSDLPQSAPPFEPHGSPTDLWQSFNED